MLFCHRGSKAQTPPLISEEHRPLSPGARRQRPTSPFDSPTDIDTPEWQLPSILTAGSLDELSASSSLLPGAPVMPAVLEAQLASLSSRETDRKYDTVGKRSHHSKQAKRRQQSLLSSASMHSLVSSTTSQEYPQVHSSSKSGTLLASVVDGNLSLPSTHKKHHHYSGLSLLSLSHHRSSNNTLRKLRSLDVQQFSSLLDFEERYNDPWVGSIS